MHFVPISEVFSSLDPLNFSATISTPAQRANVSLRLVASFIDRCIKANYYGLSLKGTFLSHNPNSSSPNVPGLVKRYSGNFVANFQLDLFDANPDTSKSFPELCFHRIEEYVTHLTCHIRPCYRNMIHWILELV